VQLIGPDDDDSFMVFNCDYRHELLTERADRFFVTPHYGDPNEPGTVVTRLSENTVDDLDELADVIEDSWRAVAPAALIAQWDSNSA